jgi:hypothetical protein
MAHVVARRLPKSNIPCDSRIAIDPPCPANTSLTVKHSELIKSKLLLQLTCHGNARSPSTNNDDWIVCIGIALIAVDSPYCFVEHLEACGSERKRSDSNLCQRDVARRSRASDVGMQGSGYMVCGTEVKLGVPEYARLEYVTRMEKVKEVAKRGKHVQRILRSKAMIARPLG